MGDIPNEIMLGLPSITLTAKGTPAVWLVIPISAVLIALAWRILAVRRQK